MALAHIISSIQNTLNAIGYMLIYISTFEFICAQSPQSMRGILICSFFAIKGLFRLLSVLVVYTPFTQWNLPYIFPSCGFVYYLINVVILLAGIATSIIAAKKYHHHGRIDYNSENVESHDQPQSLTFLNQTMLKFFIHVFSWGLLYS